MKLILLLSIILVGYCSILKFHSSYVSRFKTVPSMHLKETECESFKCNLLPLEPNQCIHKEGLKNHLKVCPAGSFCPWTLSNYHNTYCIPGSETISFGGNPGDVCNTTADCSGLSICNANNICEGRKAGGTCNDQDDCDVGFTCHNVEMNATCQPLNNLGNSCGNFLTMNLCLNTLTCNYCKCINLFSLEKGAASQEDVAALACSSGFYEPHPTQPGMVICAEAPLSPRAIIHPIACKAGSYCRSRDGKHSVPCECGFNSDGKGFCPLFPGDPIYQQYLTALKSYMTDPGLNNCHYLDVAMPSCHGVPAIKYEEVFNLKVQVQFYVIEKRLKMNANR